MSCDHKHGDFVPELFGWVCGQCYRIIGERPTKYSMVRVYAETNYGDVVPNGSPTSRQEIAWQAEILKSDQGTTLSTFLDAVARRFEKRGGLDRKDAMDTALESLRMMEAEFGDKDYDWSRMSAIDVADEDMSYWDYDEPMGNE